jgi:hypothetical protein
MCIPEHVGRSEVSERDLFALHLPDLNTLPAQVQLPSRHFVALLAADAAGIGDATLKHFARRLLDLGCVYFCAWGPDCERVHDIFDSECLLVEPVIMTTWHSGDSLDDALWFFVFNTNPDDGYSENCQSAVAITIAQPEWANHIRRRLADLNAFNRDVL